MRFELPHVVFINGPTGSGKSTLAHMLLEQDPRACIESFGDPLRQMVYTVFFPEEGPIDYSFDLHEPGPKDKNLFLKAHLDFEDRDLADIPPMSIRETMVSFADSIRAAFGQDILGRLLFKRMVEQSQFCQHFLIEDTCFEEETRFIGERVGKDNCHLIRIHRAGFEFRGDRRGYLSIHGIQTLDLHNDGDPNEMLDIVTSEFSSKGVGLNQL